MPNFTETINLLKEKFVGWYEATVLILPNLAIALVVLIIFHFISKTLRKIVEKLLRKYISNRALVNFLGILVRISVFLLGFLLAINILKLDEAVFSVLAGVGIVGLAIGFAFQDVAANFIAGIALVFRKDHPFKVGDIVETNDHIGTIEGINLRDSMIRTFQGQTIFIPNKMIFENSVVNYSLIGKRRVDLGVGVSYGDDLEKVKKIAREAVESVDDRVEGNDIEIFYEEFGDSSINFKIRFWIPFQKQTDFLKARSDAVMKIKKAFDDYDITIPFPIRTLDFGIKGGEKLSAVLNQKNLQQ